MKEKIRTNRLTAVILVLTIGFLVFWLARPRKIMEKPAGELQVTFFAAGKSDAILIEQGERRMLIDSGLDKNAALLLPYFSSHGIETLDKLVITHFDKDHVGGADRILDALEVKETLEPDYSTDSEEYLEYQDALIRNQVPLRKITTKEEGMLGRASFVLYPPEEAYDGSDNDQSLVLSLRFGEISFLFAGDSQEKRLQELMENTDLDLHHTVLKLPHHGKKEKNSVIFLEKVTPEVAVITCEDETKVSGEILETLEQLHTEIYLTCQGTVTCMTDGTELHIEQK